MGPKGANLNRAARSAAPVGRNAAPRLATLSPRLLFGFAYLLSGAAGLLYQVAWLRHVTLAFGHTHAAVSTVLAAFLGGLALGSGLADRRATASPRVALNTYAGLELFIAAYALALPPLVLLASGVLEALYGEVGGSAFATGRTAMSMLLVALPAAAMGASFPLAVRGGAALQPHPLGAGAIYTINTVGAAVGAALTGFLLLPALGFWRTTLLGVFLNVVAAGLAWWLARAASRKPQQEAPASGATVLPTRTPAPAARPTETWSRRRHPKAPASSPRALVAPAALPTLPRPWILGAAVISGFVTIALEVAWTRLLTLVLGPTTWAFALMLTVFIAGLAVGAALGTIVARRARDFRPWLALSLGLGALATLVTPQAIEPLVLSVAAAASRADASLASVLQQQVLRVAAVLLPKTVTLGATFPLVLAALVRAERDRRGPPRVGSLYAVNTWGAIVGALAAGNVLLPRLGLRLTLTVVAGCAGAMGVALVATARPRGRALAGATATGALLVSAAWLVPPLDERLLSSGAYKYSAYLGTTDLEASLAAGTLLYYRDGGGSTVTVRRVGGVTSLAIDGKVDASDGGDMLTQKLLGHLPLLLHGSARDVAVIGLGSGVTPGAVLLHHPERLDVVEISPEVVSASAHFAHVNGKPLDDPRTRLVLGDARAHVLFTTRRYDIVISEPSNPWMAGMAALFTREFFQAVRARLAPGGLACQWAHTYDMGQAELASIVATFRAAFPHVLIWLVGEGDVLLVGADRPLEPRLAQLQRDWPAPVRDDLQRLSLPRPFALLSLLAGGHALADRLAAGAPLQADDRLALEFTAPRFILGRADTDVGQWVARTGEAVGLPAAVRAAMREATSDDWQDHAVALLRAEAPRAAAQAARRALTLDPTRTAAVTTLLDAAAATHDLDEAERALTTIAEASRSPAPAIGLSRLAASRGDYPGGIAHAREALERSPGSPEAWEQLASVVADAGDADGLRRVADELRARFPDRPATAYFDAAQRFLSGDLAGAVSAGRLAAWRGDAGSRAWNLVGAAQARLNDTAAARAAFDRARQADPRDVTGLVNLAQLAAATGDVARAHDLYAEALAVAPREPAALEGLAGVLDARGEHARAARLRALLPPG